MLIRGISTTTALICFSASVGKWVDRSPSRLRALLITITANRVSIILASIGWLAIVGTDSTGLGQQQPQAAVCGLELKPGGASVRNLFFFLDFRGLPDGTPKDL